MVVHPSFAQRFVHFVANSPNSLPVPTGSSLTDAARADLARAVGNDILKAPTIDEALRSMPVEFNGSTGAFRNHSVPNMTAADTDMDAIDVWIRAKAGTAHTQRLYRREANRFLLWALAYKGKQLGDITVPDVLDFQDWLAESKPGPKWPRTWRVFAGKKLSDESRKVAMNVIQGLYTYLVLGGYLAANPFLMVKNSQAEADVQRRMGGDKLDKTVVAKPDRFFPGALWKWIREQLDRPFSKENWPNYKQIVNPRAAPAPERIRKKRRTKAEMIRDEAAGENAAPKAPRYLPGKQHELVHKWSQERVERLRFIVLFGYYTAVRRSELAAGNMGQIVEATTEDDDLAWVWIMMHAKGLRDGEHPVLDLREKEMRVLARYRESRGLSPLPEGDESTVPLVAALGSETFIADEQINHELKMFFSQCADRVTQAGVPASWAKKLRLASAHWLRHTFGSHSAASGITLTYTADRMRHRAADTTRKYYVHLDIKEKQKERAKLDKFNPD
jgi:integrase